MAEATMHSPFLLCGFSSTQVRGERKRLKMLSEVMYDFHDTDACACSLLRKSKGRLARMI